MSNRLSMVNTLLCRDRLLVVADRGTNAQGQAMFLVEFAGCRHQEVRSGNALRRAHKLGVRPRCFACGRKGRAK